MKTKVLTLLITLALTLSLASCGKTETTEIDVIPNQDKIVVEKDVTTDDKKSPSILDEKDKPSDEQADKPHNKPENDGETSSSDDQKADTQEQQPSDTPDNVPPPSVEPTLEAASTYIGKSVSGLAAAIGQPSGKTYVTSCIGDGEDGEWYYPGFTVYTYRDPNGSEKIIDVLVN